MKLKSILIIFTSTVLLTACNQISMHTGIKDHNLDYKQTKSTVKLDVASQQIVNLGDDYPIPALKDADNSDNLTLIPPDEVPKKLAKKA